MSDLSLKFRPSLINQRVRIKNTRADDCYGRIIGPPGCEYTALDLRRDHVLFSHCVKIMVPTEKFLKEKYVDVNTADLEIVNDDDIIAAEIMRS